MTMKLFLTMVLCGSMAAGAQEDGKVVVERVCTKCHGMAATMRQRNSRDRWTAIVDNMVARGAEGTDAELETIVDYLSKTLPLKIAVNKAGADELASGLGLTKTAAAAIVEYRQKNGAFRSVDDLKKVPGLDPADIETKKDRIDFGEPK